MTERSEQRVEDKERESNERTGWDYGGGGDLTVWMVQRRADKEEVEVTTRMRRQGLRGTTPRTQRQRPKVYKRWCCLVTAWPPVEKHLLREKVCGVCGVRKVRRVLTSAAWSCVDFGSFARCRFEMSWGRPWCFCGRVEVLGSYGILSAFVGFVGTETSVGSGGV
eukprot:9465963-Pyramimonas_sp.AAC.1